MFEASAHPAAEIVRRLPVGVRTTVRLSRVLLQRAHFIEFCTMTLLEPSFEVLLQKASEIAAAGCATRFAKVLEHRPAEGGFLVKAGVGWQPGVVGHALVADDLSNPAGESFRTRQPVDVRDVRRRRDYHLPPLYRDHRIVSAANVPIAGIAGFYGVLEVDRAGLKPFDGLDSSFLASIAGVIADAHERVRRQNALQTAHDARAVLLREHHHRVRNSYQVLTARLQRHAAEATTENSRKRFHEVERRVFALAALYDHLVGSELPQDRIDLGRYLDDLCERMREFYGLGDRAVELRCTCDEGVALDVATVTSLGAVVNELVANAADYAFGPAGGRIEIGLRREAGAAILSIADNGSGLGSPRPESLGLSIVHQLVAGSGGSIAATVTGGTRWTIHLPLTESSPLAAEEMLRL
ncbi:MAG TPA: sensor histidine kinase [Stellaceae bacterium]|nr:sensor histidine kinase [Stellaceae bacterium]